MKCYYCQSNLSLSPHYNFYYECLNHPVNVLFYINLSKMSIWLNYHNKSNPTIYSIHFQPNNPSSEIEIFKLDDKIKSFKNLDLIITPENFNQKINILLTFD